MDVSKPEEIVLKSVATYHLLSVEQITKLHYSRGSVKYVSALLKEMAEKKLLFRPERHSLNEPYIYMLGIRGTAYLRDIGVDVDTFHPSEHKTFSRFHIQHVLSVNDVLIASSFLSTACPGYEVYQLKHDLTLKKELKGVIPDGWMDIWQRNEQYCFWLEVDRGTMEQKRIREKIRLLVRFARDEYERIFGTPSLTILFITPAGQKRCDLLCAWCEKELLDMGEEKQADMFRFAVTPENMDAQKLFFEPIWKIPGRKDVQRLLEC